MGFSVRHDLFTGRTAHTKCGLYLRASSLAVTLQGRGASLGNKPVLAGSGWECELAARVGWVRSLACFSILLERGLHNDGSDSFSLGRSDPHKLETEVLAVTPRTRASSMRSDHGWS